MEVRSTLSKIVGADNCIDDPARLRDYESDLSHDAVGAALCVVRPGSSKEVSEVVSFCNENLIPLVPSSSKVHFYGAAVPSEGGVVMDMTRMNRILEVDTENRRVRFEAGVNWAQLTRALKDKGYRVIMPLTPPAERSVLTDFLEREEPVNQVYDYGEPLQAMEIVWPTGEIFRLGSASVEGYPDSPSRGANPSGPGLDFYRFFQCAQGTMGVVTWTNLKMESIPKMDKILFAPAQDLQYLNEFLHRIMPRRIGQEVLILNNVDLAALLSEKWPSDFEILKSSLPPWTLILVLSGLMRRPEEKIAYEEHFLSEVIRNEFSGIRLGENLPGFSGLGQRVLNMLREPWPSERPYWRLQVKGAFKSLFFHCRPANAKPMVSMVREMAAAKGFNPGDLGVYIQPIEHNRACRPEITLFYDPEKGKEKGQVNAFYRLAARELLKEGAVFTRPYGDLAAIVYEKAASYATQLKRLKKIFDPNNIMNPSKLCF